jgi:hypothetical protein
MWVVQLMGINPVRDVTQEGGSEKAVQQFGVALSWLLLNRHGLKVFVHSNVAMPFGDVETEIVDHTQYALWMGAVDPAQKMFDIEFFYQLLKKDPKVSQEESMKRRINATATSNIE